MDTPHEPALSAAFAHRGLKACIVRAASLKLEFLLGAEAFHTGWGVGLWHGQRAWAVWGEEDGALVDPGQLQDCQRDRHPLGAPGHMRQQGAHLHSGGKPLRNIIRPCNALYITYVCSPQLILCIDAALGQALPSCLQRAYQSTGACNPLTRPCTQRVCHSVQGDDDWVKLNAGQYGFYRVQYPDELWHRLTLVAARVVDEVPMLPEVEFAGLLDDAWALNEAGGLPIHIFLNLTRYCAFQH